MNLFRVIAAALSLMLFSGVAHAQNNGPVQEVGPWGIYKNADHCRALAIFQESVVSIAYYKSANRTTMMFLDDKAFASAQNGQPVDAKLVFVKNDDLDTSYLGTAITGVQLENGKKGGYLASPGDGLLTTFGQSSIVGLLQGEEVLISIKIEVPTQMVAALRKCANG